MSEQPKENPFKSADYKLGLALSGGGFRASLSHIGVLARLAELDLLKSVSVLSMVSGGSIVGAACMSRRLGILYGAPVSATESGEMAERDNPYFSLLPEMEVQGIQQFLG